MKKLQIGVASMALLWAGQAFAQETPDAEVGRGQEAVGSGEANMRVMEAIVVTAQRRSERLVDVPISVSTVSYESMTLAGQDSLLSLNKLVPGVYVSQPLYFLAPTVRGVGSTLSVSNESAVAVYIDGVYQPAQASNVFDLASIAGVEVLKGPQGTLFGRNATGGAILVKTLDPSFEREGQFNMSYSRFGEVRTNGYANFPISDKLAVNGAISYRHSPGYIRDVKTEQITNEANSLAVRGKLLFLPTENLEVILTGAHTEYDDPTASNYQSFEGKSSLAGLPGAGPVATDRFHLSHGDKDVLKISAQEYTAHITFDIEAGTVSSITALKRDSLVTRNDADNTYLPLFRVDFTFKQRTFSHEINFTSPSSDNFSYVVGAYYYHNYKYYEPFAYNGVDFLEMEQWSDSLAGYADGTYEFGDLALIGGIRYSTEKRKMDNALLSHPLIPLAGQGSRHIERQESAWTPRVGLRYALTDRSNVYGTYSRGFKSGAFNSTSLTDPGVSPETINAFELGYKVDAGHFTLNAAAYYSSYSDIQVNTLVITNGVALNSVANAAKARIYGFEFDGTYQFSDALNVHATFGYTNAEYSSFPNATGYNILPSGASQTISIDASGNSMVRQPKYQASAQVRYTVPVGENSLTFTLSPSYNSRVYYDFSNQLSQGPVFLLDGSIDFALQDGLKISVFGQNITDRSYYITKRFSTFDTSVTYAKPATYGMKLSYEF